MKSNASIQAPGAAPFDRLADQYDRWFETDRGGNLRCIQLVREACVLLTEGKIPANPLRTDDDLASAMIRLPEAPMPGKAGREACFAWHRDQFFGDWKR